MKRSLYALVFAAALSARAGMPDIEAVEVLVEEIEKTPAGWVATITGELMIPTVNPRNPDQWLPTTLFADKARVTVSGGNQLYALSLSGADKYEKRLKSMVGQKVFVQIWGATLTIQAGRVVQINGGDVSLLRPQKGEAAFDLGRLPEIIAK
jgi:hypothetical protein